MDDMGFSCFLVSFSFGFFSPSSGFNKWERGRRMWAICRDGLCCCLMDFRGGLQQNEGKEMLG